MKIYYNRHYSSRPYTDLKAEDCFGTVRCGSEELLSIMMLHSGQIALYEEAMRRAGRNVCDRLICYFSLRAFVRLIFRERHIKNK